jgi:hypothetical protein
MGAFVSEGNLPENGSIKITCKNTKFLDHITDGTRSLFGENIATNKPPTPEHKNRKYGYHKYFSVRLSKNFNREF